jgi:phosphatidylserine/phosphatidylglycerophosphate/cardiolipin synthase-like enzyme
MACLVVMPAGCASMPRVERLLQTAEGHPGLPTLCGPEGQRSPRAAKSLVADLEKENHDSHLLRAQLTIAAASPGNPPLYLGNNDRDHGKLLIVDGKTAFAGGVNVSGRVFREFAGESRNCPGPTPFGDA